MQVFVQDNLKSNNEMMDKLKDRVDSPEYELGLASERFSSIDNDRSRLEDSVTYL